MKPTVTIITTTQNVRRSIPSLLKSISSQNYRSFEVIIVEHGIKRASKHPCLEPLGKKVKHLHSQKDLGFCRANNLAAKKAKGDYLFFVNDDVTLDPNCIKNLIASISQKTKNPSTSLRTGKKQKTIYQFSNLAIDHKVIAVIQPKIRSSKFPSFFEYAGAAGGFIDKWGYPFCRGRVFFTVEEDQGQYDKNGEIFWATGTAFFIRKGIFLKFSGFDERFFAYHEETDLCWRLSRAGYKIVFAPKAIVYHQGEMSWRHRRLLKTFLIHRNHYWLLAKNHSISQYIRLLPMKVFLDLAAFFYYAIHGGFTSCFAAILGTGIGLLTSPFFFKWGDRGNMGINYFGSIAIAYFLKGRKTYHELIGKKIPKDIKTKKYEEFYNR